MKKLIWIAIVTTILLVTFNPFVIIPAGHRGVVVNLGAVSDKVLQEGFHLRTPILQNIQIIDVRMQKEEVSTGAASKDLQELKTTIALNYHLGVGTVNQLYQKVGMDYKNRVIDPAVQEAVKAATAKYTAEEVVTKRQIVRDDMKRIITERLAREFILVDEVSITDFDFSESFNKAIEAKVTAEQLALQAKNVLEQKKFEADQTITTARAEAEKIRIQAESISKQGGQSYVQLKAIEKWDGKLPIQMIPNATVPFLDLNQIKPDVNQNKKEERI